MDDFWQWAYARHQNPLSWLIRPWFLVPYCYFAWKRRPWGIVLTLLALASSMFWFPVPETVDPRVAEFLAMEKAWIAAPWTWSKLLEFALVPLSLTLLALAFWKHSLAIGLLLINLIALGKIVWSVLAAPEAGWMVVPFALIGLLVCNGAILWAWRRAQAKAAGNADKSPV